MNAASGQVYNPTESLPVLDSRKNVWTTPRIMWNSAVAWQYVTGELRVELAKSRRLRMRSYSVQEVKRILANTKGAEQLYFWLAAETGLRAGELIALHASDVDVETLAVEVIKAIWGPLRKSD